MIREICLIRGWLFQTAKRVRESFFIFLAGWRRIRQFRFLGGFPRAEDRTMGWKRLLIRAWVGAAIVGCSFFAGVFFTAGRGGNHLVDWVLFGLAAAICISGVGTLMALFWPCSAKRPPQPSEATAAVRSR
jgi:hypothetical protein